MARCSLCRMGSPIWRPESRMNFEPGRSWRTLSAIPWDSRAGLMKWSLATRSQATSNAIFGGTQYAYDGIDQVVSAADPRSLVTGYTVNGLGNLTQMNAHQYLLLAGFAACFSVRGYARSCSSDVSAIAIMTAGSRLESLAYQSRLKPTRMLYLSQVRRGGKVSRRDGRHSSTALAFLVARPRVDSRSWHFRFRCLESGSRSSNARVRRWPSPWAQCDSTTC
jgi:hypothetical protein